MIIIKYAYLIIANRNKAQLQKLITMLDDSRNDIYLLIDKKSNINNFKFKVNYSNIDYLKPINIYWGSYSQIQAELDLFKAAYNDHYFYYHLMSGQGLPLVNQDIIHHFFDNHPYYEFIQYQTESKRSINDKLNSHLFIQNYDDGVHSEHSNKDYIFKILCSIYRHFETLFNEYRIETNIPLNKVSAASTWVSVDDSLVKLIINSSEWIYSHFYRSKVADELFIPTLLNYHPSILNKVYNTKLYSKSPATPLSNLRYIKKDSIESHPKTWTIKDYDELRYAKRAGYLFSRKFDSHLDNDIIKKVFYDVMRS